MTWDVYTRANHISRSVFALDATGKIRVWNTAMERLVGIEAAAVIGKPWDRIGLRAERTWLLAGQGLRTGELTLRPRSGPIRVSVVVWPVCSRDHKIKGVMCSIDHITHAAAAPLEPDHQCYEIATDADPIGFGQIVRMDGADQRPVGKRCYEAIAGRGTPCATCPVPGLTVVGGSETVVMPDRGDAFVVVRATRLTHRTAMLSRTRIQASEITGLARARLDAIAGQRKLSDREREVMHRLAWGASVVEIGLTLDITPRTVKFHAANVLAKLGLDSRLELVRLALDATTTPPPAATTGPPGSAAPHRPGARARTTRPRQSTRRRRS